MEKLIVDLETADALRDSLDDIEVCGPDGEFLGRFKSGKLMQLYHNLNCPDSPEELRRRRDEEDGCTTDELLARLEAESCATK